MLESVRYWRILTTLPGVMLREEGVTPRSIFGPGVESVVSDVMPGLHIRTRQSDVVVSLDNPVRGGPVSVVEDGKERLVVPGEEVVIQGKEAAIFLKHGSIVQIILVGESWSF